MKSFAGLDVPICLAISKGEITKLKSTFKIKKKNIDRKHILFNTTYIKKNRIQSFLIEIWQFNGKNRIPTFYQKGQKL